MRRRWGWKNSQSSMKQLHCNQVLLVAYNIDTMISTHENYIYQNMKMEFILSKKLENQMSWEGRVDSSHEHWTELGLVNNQLWSKLWPHNSNDKRNKTRSALASPVTK